jgi:hypothetical protein
MKARSKQAANRQKWTVTSIVSSLALPAAMAMIPGMRRRYGLGLFSLPSVAMMGGLYLLQRMMQKRS